MKNPIQLLSFSIVFLICLASALQMQAQMDTLFWFAAPRNPSFGQPVRLVVSTGAAAANVSVTQPAVGATMPPINFTVAPNSVHGHDLTPHLAILQAHPAATPLPYGLKVVSDVPVLVYYEAQGLNGTNWVNAEVYTLKGTGGMGTSFLIPSQNFVGNSPAYGGNSRNSFNIVATEDNTSITITPTAVLDGGYAANTPFSITLNRGEVWAATALNRGATSHLPGSTVVADKPVSVTVNDDALEGTHTAGGSYGICVDLVGDQIVPVSSLGTEYIAMNGRLTAPGDQLFITALQNNTEIYRDGGAIPVATINAGQTHRMPVVVTTGQTSTYIRTSDPVAVWQLTGMGCEMGATQLPQIECSGSSSVIYSRTMPWDLYVNLMVQTGGQGNFILNGSPLTGAAWTAVPGTANQWFVTQLNLSSVVAQGAVLTMVNTTHLFHMSVLDGASTNSTSYGYFSNYSRVVAEATASSNKVCTGDTIELYAMHVAGATYQWTGPAGFSSVQQNPVVTTVGQQQTGWYHLTVSTGTTGCGSGYDSIYISVHDIPVTDLGTDIAVCRDSMVIRGSTPYNPLLNYQWSTGNSSDSLIVYASDTYWLEISDTNGCGSRDSIVVDLGSLIQIDLGPDMGLCDKDLPIVLSSTQPAGTKYLWSNGLSDPTLEVIRTGRYWLQVERDGCYGSDTIDILVVETPYIFIGKDSTICAQKPLRIGYEVAGSSYLWNTGATTPFISVNSTDDYMLTVNLNGCIVHDSIHIVAMEDPQPDLGPDQDICLDQTIILNGSYGNNSVYRWNTGETTASISVEDPGTYYVTVTDEYTCVGSDTILLLHYPDPVVMLGPDTTVCEETPLHLSAWTLNTDSVRWSDGSVGKSILIYTGGDYIATAINKCNAVSDTMTARQIFCDIWVPNAFTPNGDGINDIFRVLGNIGRIDAFTLMLFNRWGEPVFVTKDKMEGWDGLKKSVPAPLGTYVYMLQYSVDNRFYTQSGNFHLLR